MILLHVRGTIPVSHSFSLFNQKQPAAVANRPHAAVRRPQRAAATSTKSYKEPDTDSTQSESEMPPVSKAKVFPTFYAALHVLLIHFLD